MLTPLEIFGIMVAAVVLLAILDMIICVIKLEAPPFEEDADFDTEIHEPEDY